MNFFNGQKNKIVRYFHLYCMFIFLDLLYTDGRDLLDTQYVKFVSGTRTWYAGGGVGGGGENIICARRAFLPHPR